MASKKYEYYCEFLKKLTAKDILLCILDLISDIKAEGSQLGLHPYPGMLQESF